MLTDLWKSTDSAEEDFKIEMEELKKSHSELKNTVTEIKNTMEGMNNRWKERRQSMRWKLDKRNTEKLRNRKKKRSPEMRG